MRHRVDQWRSSLGSSFVGPLCHVRNEMMSLVRTVITDFLSISPVSETQSWSVKIVSWIIICGAIMSCKKWNDVPGTYCHNRLFMHSWECYFGVYCLHYFTTQEINTKITQTGAHSSPNIIDNLYIHFEAFQEKTRSRNHHELMNMITGICSECRDHFVYAPNQWETTLHCNVSHSLDASTKQSLWMWNKQYM